MTILRHIFALFTASLMIASCSTDYPVMQKNVAQRIAAPAFMVPRVIDAGTFALSAYERMHETNAPAHIYIEGDGASPMSPVALHLSSRDKSDNVAWLGRPCQFDAVKISRDDCPQEFWNGAQYSDAIINGYRVAMDNIKATYGITEFHVIGYNGGAPIAAILAATRVDTVSLRTVAGVLNPQTDGLSPLDYRASLSNIPQIHFLGDLDTKTNLADIDAYMAALGSERCTTYEIVQNAGHTKGWVNKWPALLGKKPACAAPPPVIMDDFVPYDPRPPAIYRPRDPRLEK